MSRKYLLDCSANGAKWADDVHESDLDLSDFILAMKVACRTLARRRGRALRLA